MLSDKDIKKALEDKWIEISPLDQGYIHCLLYTSDAADE